MSLNKGKELILTVLCPNGRRVKVRATQTTCIGQVIEEACHKHQYDPLEYNIKHIKRTLDPSSTLQYTNIPNHAQLELIGAPSRRTEGLVTVHLVIESGEKLIENFPPSTTLWDILQLHNSQNTVEWTLPDASSDLKPVIIYTMRKIKNEELQTVTLRDLGLYNGKCIMRYSVEKCSGSLSVSGNPILQVPKNVTSVSESESITSTQFDVNKSNEMSPPNTLADNKIDSVKDLPCQLTDHETENVELHHDSAFPVLGETKILAKEPEDLKNLGKHLTGNQPCQNSESYDVAIHTNASEVLDTENHSEYCVIPLSDHDSILFNLDDAPPAASLVEDDDIFNLTVNEVRRLYKEQVDKVKEFDEQPLMTKQMRQFEKDARLLSAMNHYPVTQIRICFPDRHVVQANFKPRTLIKEVMDFLRPLLASPNIDFYLFLNFPRTVLLPEINLVEAGCIPKARIYFGSDEYSSHSFLSQDALSKKSSFAGASNAVLQSRNINETVQNYTHRVVTETAGSSSKQQLSDNVTHKVQATPKWFTIGKKK